MASIKPQPENPGGAKSIAPMPHPAGFFSRAEALIIDLVILIIIQFVGSAFAQVIIRLLKFSGVLRAIIDTLENVTFQVTLGSIIVTLFVIGYFTFFWSLVGFTPGKAILGLRVLKQDGERISFWRALVRLFGYWISALPIFLGFLWVLWDPKRRAWHDKIAGTQVLYIPKKPR